MCCTVPAFVQLDTVLHSRLEQEEEHYLQELRIHANHSLCYDDDDHTPVKGRFGVHIYLQFTLQVECCVSNYEILRARSITPGGGCHTDQKSSVTCWVMLRFLLKVLDEVSHYIVRHERGNKNLVNNDFACVMDELSCHYMMMRGRNVLYIPH